MKKNPSIPRIIPILIILGIIIISSLAWFNFTPPIETVEVVIPHEIK